jgi:hypothetical protein
MVAASRRPTASRELRPRLLRTAILGGTLVTSVLLTLHLTLPGDYALRETLLLPYERQVLTTPVDVEPESAGWSLPDLTGPDLRRTYRVFQPTPQPDYQEVGAGVVPADILSDGCLEKWLGQGEACDPDEVADKAGDLDVVWTWVNGQSYLRSLSSPSARPLARDT